MGLRTVLGRTTAVGEATKYCAGISANVMQYERHRVHMLIIDGPFAPSFPVGRSIVSRRMSRPFNERCSPADKPVSDIFTPDRDLGGTTVQHDVAILFPKNIDHLFANVHTSKVQSPSMTTTSIN
jgi:hypothetical protein